MDNDNQSVASRGSSEGNLERFQKKQKAMTVDDLIHKLSKNVGSQLTGSNGYWADMCYSSTYRADFQNRTSKHEFEFPCKPGTYGAKADFLTKFNESFFQCKGTLRKFEGGGFKTAM